MTAMRYASSGRLDRHSEQASCQRKSARQKTGGRSKNRKLWAMSALAANRCPGNAADIRAVDAEIEKLSGAHAAEFGDRLTVLAPIVERACYIHDNPLSWAFEAQLPVLGASFASMASI